MFKNLNIKWKISLIIIILIMLVMLVVAIIIYRYTSNTLLEQINDKISIMSKYEKSKIIEVKNDVELRVSRTIKNTSLKYYIDTINNDYLNETKDKSNYEFTFEDFLQNVSSGQNLILKKIKDDIRYIAFVYITTREGIVIADSRESVVNYPMKYVGKKLEISNYKNIKTGDLEYFNNTPLLFINYPIFNENENEIGYFIIALYTEIFSQNLNDILSTYGKVTLINKEGIVLNDNGEQLTGEKIRKKWFLEQIKNNFESKQYKTNENLLILNKITATNIYFAVEIPLSKINKPAINIRNIVIYII